MDLYKKLTKKLPELDFSHINNRKNFYNYYKELGKNKRQLQQKYNHTRLDAFLPYLKDPIIELGCHIGFNLTKFAGLGFNDITGVDVSPTLIEEARRLMEIYHDLYKQKKGHERFKKLSIILIESFIEDLPEDKKYKTVVLTDILEHVIDVHPILEKAKNLLDKDGLIFINSPDVRKGAEGHVRGVSKEEITKWLEDHDLGVYKWLYSQTGGDTTLIAVHNE